MIRHRFLMWLTAGLPAKAIDLDGQHYIERYHVLTRGNVTVYLHRYLGADGDRSQHNHPWRWAIGIPLIGGYIESRLVSLCPLEGMLTKGVTIRPWRWNWISDGCFHRIAVVKSGTWTLFIHGERYKFWGEIRSDLSFGAIPGVRPTQGSWYKNAPNGRQLRLARGTNS